MGEGCCDKRCRRGGLTELVKAKLEMAEPLHALTLHVAEVDDAGNVLSVENAALPSRKTLAEVKLADRASIVVKVSDAASEYLSVQCLRFATCRATYAASPAALTISCRTTDFRTCIVPHGR